MNDVRLLETVKKLQENLLEYGPDHTRLLLQVIRQLAHGRPITTKLADHLIADLGIAKEEAHQFLREVTERDETDQIVGAMG